MLFSFKENRKANLLLYQTARQLGPEGCCVASASRAGLKAENGVQLQVNGRMFSLTRLTLVCVHDSIDDSYQA